ncbi:phosphoenolpyruvate synthase [Streptomyces sp. F001]|uniref:PEP-utilizing enzyme n=1 Tax=Streptomyces sp. F001 TaxID=1510026 RepID=UPI00101E6068|nr:PEP-utilizing enzyme [Streptomyces sp. F001]RZB17008.1 phosphoenolpyruvate synthase [Streptomyces sp. F001]
MTARVRLGTKAESLSRVSPLLRSGRVMPLRYFTVAEWRAQRDEIASSIVNSTGFDQPLIVRSSARCEDSAQYSAAGHFLSVAGVQGSQALRQAVDSVIASYQSSLDDDQVLVQPEARTLTACGVAASCDPSTGGPYYVVNWTDSAETFAVTAGADAALRTWYRVSHGPAAAPPEGFLEKVVVLLSELEVLTGLPHLQAEFGIDNTGEPILFQVRRLTNVPSGISFERHRAALRIVDQQLRDRSPNVYGVMPDWNPAEIIGIRPRPLALSLYRALLTDRAWSVARGRYGYRVVDRSPVLVDFAGAPYVDCRASFTSLVPADLDEDLASWLVEYYLHRLASCPHLHDKVEFDIAFTCYTFDLDTRLRRLRSAGFDTDDCRALSHSLRSLTRKLLTGPGPWQEDQWSIRELARRRRDTADGSPSSASRMKRLLHDCMRYGTVSFAGLARSAFVATELLTSLVRTAVITPAERQAFAGGLQTVAAKMSRDFHRMAKEDFLLLYGHLRPGTYDILSPRYDEAPHTYFSWQQGETPASQRSEFRPSALQTDQLTTKLKEADFPVTPEQFFSFLARAITARELAKFEFTHNLSDALLALRLLGEQADVDTDDLSYVDYSTITQLTDDSALNAALLRRAAEEGRAAHRTTESLSLPPVIASRQDVWSFEMPPTQPNFVTQRRVLAPVARVTDGEPVEGCIAFLVSADPGYDWLFTRGIAGLVTCYGGVNSHMAVRAQELNVPAVIGAGETRFHLWSGASSLEIDSVNMSVRVVA